MAASSSSYTPPPALRVSYATGRMLGVEDFQAEQSYHRGRLARALFALHGTGTVTGLNVTSNLSTDLSQLEIQVSPGIAIDRAGRILDVPVTVCIRPQAWLAGQTDSDLTLALKSGSLLVDVFATFAEWHARQDTQLRNAGRLRRDRCVYGQPAARFLRDATGAANGRDTPAAERPVAERRRVAYGWRSANGGSDSDVEAKRARRNDVARAGVSGGYGRKGAGHYLGLSSTATDRGEPKRIRQSVQSQTLPRSPSITSRGSSCCRLRWLHDGRARLGARNLTKSTNRRRSFL